MFTTRARRLLSGILAAALVLSLMKFLLTSRSARPFMTRLLPPGTGPSDELQRNGCFRVTVRTRTSTGARYVVTVAAKADPGADGL